MHLIARRMELAALAYAANAAAKATREVLWPELRLFGTLCAIYTAAFGGPPSYSAKRTTPIGDIPGVRFCREVIRLILERHDTVDPELDSRLLERLATLMHGPHAVRERILEALRGGSHRKR